MRFIKVAIKVVVIVAAVICLADGVVLFTFAHYRPQIDHADSVIILGAAINTPALYNRTAEGLHLYEDGKADVMVLSGGKIAEADISEAQYMEKVIQSKEEGDDQYILEDKSHNTYENITNSKTKLGDKTNSVIIVSDEFHLARAVILAKREGFKKVYWSSPKPTYYDASDLRFYYFREFVAIINYIPKFIFG